MTSLLLNSKMEISITCKSSLNSMALTNTPFPNLQELPHHVAEPREGGRTGAVSKDNSKDRSKKHAPVLLRPPLEQTGLVCGDC